MSIEVKIKICGIRTLEAAEVAVDAGADYIGFNFIHDSKRRIGLKTALEIVNQVGNQVKIVGVFRNQPLVTVRYFIQKYKLDFVQLHGSEAPVYCDDLNVGVIKAFQLDSDFDVDEARKQMRRYKVAYYMVDRAKQGEGEMLNVEKVRSLAQEFPLIISGGITPENVGKIVREVRPHGVDVASGVETNEQQDPKKIRLFIKEVNEVA